VNIISSPRIFVPKVKFLNDKFNSKDRVKIYKWNCTNG